jgi:hypothetical protein
VGGARAQRLDRGLDDMRRGREVRFADLQVDDLGAGVLQGPGAGEYLERPLGAELGYPVGELESSHGLDHRARVCTDAGAHGRFSGTHPARSEREVFLLNAVT